jgi:YfiR/HmsC-like
MRRQAVNLVARNTLAAMCALSLGLLSLGKPAARGRQGRVSAEQRQVAMLLRALTYEERLTSRAGLDVHVGIVGREHDVPSDRSVMAMSLAFQALGNVYVQGLPVKTSPLAYQDARAFAALLERRGIDVVYVCPGLERELAQILEITRKRQVLSIGGSQDHVHQGASIGVFPVEGDLTMFVNLAATREEGAAFAPAFLRLARVIR